jgi:acetylornithine deacetylase
VNLETQLRLTRELVDLDSTTGQEGAVSARLAGILRGLGYAVVEQPVSGDRCNVFATAGLTPDVVLSTHIDCVPPFFGSRIESGRVYGRGTCDAKGIAVAEIAASERLRASGVKNVGLLFVVGEERGSDGAKLADTIAPGSRFLVNGEPTDCRLASATRGLYRIRLHTSGRAAHTSQPHLGESAIEKLVDAVAALRDVEWPADPDLGRTFYTVGMIKGGVAPNVVPAAAEAEVLFRTVGEPGPLRLQVERAVEEIGATLEEVFTVPPVRLKTLPGFDTAVFNFTTDIPFLSRWGVPLLLGPGSVTKAHTADEYVEIEELSRSVDLYVGLAEKLLATPN